MLQTQIRAPASELHTEPRLPTPVLDARVPTLAISILPRRVPAVVNPAGRTFLLGSVDLATVSLGHNAVAPSHHTSVVLAESTRVALAIQTGVNPAGVVDAEQGPVIIGLGNDVEAVVKGTLVDMAESSAALVALIGA